MTPDKYREMSLITESNDFATIRERLKDEKLQTKLMLCLWEADKNMRQLDALKRSLFYGTEFRVKPSDVKMKLDLDVLENLDDKSIRLLHAALGITTEGGELLSAVYTKLGGGYLDEVNYAEELGDVFWYQAIAADALQVSFQKIWATNIAKLVARFKGKFSSYFALNRELDKERTVLEE